MPENSTMSMTMVPWLHFTGGDNLFFEMWRPTSSGAIAGACIGLAILAMFDRWVAASRQALESHWLQRSLLASSRPARTSLASPEKPTSPDIKVGVHAESGLSISNDSTPVKRMIPPFNLMHDIPRGLIHATQSLLAYILMLAVMTFNAAYIISIVLGLGLGEAIFGRMGNARQSATHHS